MAKISELLTSFFDLHRHDEFSTFDGFGKAHEAAAQAAKLGYPCLGLSNHGNVSGLIKHYQACLENNIKPILGLEAYFQPKFDTEKERYHLGLHAMNKDGWASLMTLTHLSATETFYKKPNITFKQLKKHNKGLICTSACIAGPIAAFIKDGKIKKAEKLMFKFKEIFEDRFYIEIMPYELDFKIEKEEAQKYVNEKLMKLAKKHNIPCILTTDSHYIKKKDFDTYLIMHEIAKSSYGAKYGERYMPTQKAICKRFLNMHGDKKALKQMLINMKELQDRFQDGDWLRFDMQVPHFADTPEESYKIMKKKCIKKLKKEGKWGTSYKGRSYNDRLKHELAVIKHHGFQDYFLLVEDYVNEAKRRNIAVGPGRGSAGNSIANYGLSITEVDAVYFDNDFDRFLRFDKKKMPDIDVDFCTNRRYEVIDYIVKKYKGQALQMASYGIYKAKFLVNDLGKVFQMTPEEINSFKTIAQKYSDEDILVVDKKAMLMEPEMIALNRKYTDVVKHYCKLFGQVRYFGKHAAAVAIMNDQLCTRVGTMKQGDMFKTTFDLVDIGFLNVLKLDILGLKTVTQVKEVEMDTGETFNYKMLEDPKVYEALREGRTEGIFQFESDTAKKILAQIETENIEDATAASGLNRPAPLKLKIPEKFAKAKKEHKDNKSNLWYKYTKDTYGMIVYQEHVMRICRHIGEMPWEVVDKIMKFNASDEQLKEWEVLFIKGATKNGLTKQQAKELFGQMMLYLFNKGHGTAYTIISLEQMYQKVHYPIYFWRSALRYSSENRDLYKAKAVQDGCVILLPHVNGGAQDGLEKFEKELVLREGLNTIKNVGDKAASVIEQERIAHGDYKSKEDFLERVPKRQVNAKVIKALEENGALIFNQKTFMKRVIKYNSSLYARFN